MRTMIFATVLMTTLPPAAQAASSFTPPQSCTTWMTVQARACRVSQYYKCTGDAPGDQWRADFDQDGMFFVSRIDAETQWIESYDLFPKVKQTLDPNPKDAASFTALLGGIDTFAFNLSKDDGRHTRVRGFDKLTGKSVVIDGITLQQTEFEFEEHDADGNLLRRSKGNEYVNTEWRNFFAGPAAMSIPLWQAKQRAPPLAAMRATVVQPAKVVKSKPAATPPQQPSLALPPECRQRVWSALSWRPLRSQPTWRHH